jgi:hypothetical protein
LLGEGTDFAALHAFGNERQNFAADEAFEFRAALGHSSRSRNLWESDAVRSSP